MAASIFAQVTLFISPTVGGDSGFTESWYVAANDLQAAMAKVLPYVDARRGVLSREWYVEAIRVSDIIVLGDSLERNFNPTEGKGLFATDAAPAETCIYCRVEAGPGRRRMLPLRGIPFNQLNKDNTLALTNAYWQALNTYSLWFTNNPGLLLMRQLTRGNPIQVDMHANVRDPRAIDINPSPGWALPNTPVGADFVIFGVPQDKGYGYNGKWICNFFGGGTITTSPKRKHYTLGLTASGTFSTLLHAFPDITSLQPERGGSRKTGRPFGSPRGRLSATRH